jgi:hypothetical protein
MHTPPEQLMFCVGLLEMLTSAEATVDRRTGGKPSKIGQNNRLKRSVPFREFMAFVLGASKNYTPMRLAQE